MTTVQPADLESCAREPIHIPGSIQPHGALLVLDPDNLNVLQASENAGAMLGCSVRTGMPVPAVQVDAAGAAIVFGDDCRQVGRAPNDEQVRAIIAWLEERGETEAFSSDNLAAQMRAAEAFSNVASGLLAIRISELHPSWLLWFRPEIVSTVEGERHVTLAGPPVKLGPKTALALSLIFHELVANAVKYGSLSREKGRVTAEWLTEPTNDDAENVKLVWTESGGPRVTPPQRQGFGTTLIERRARYELDGEAVLRYPETGFVCELRFSALSI